MEDTQTIINLINIVLFVIGLFIIGAMAVILKALEDGTAKYVKTSGKHIYLYGLRGAVDKNYYT